MNLNELGKIVQTHWFNIPNYYPHVELGEFILMPNHLHGLLKLTPSQNVRVGSRLCRDLPPLKYLPSIQPPISHKGGVRLNGPGSLSSVIRNFKSYSTHEINQKCGDPGDIVWQRNDYDHIVTSEKALWAIREYIQSNPKNWEWDPDYRGESVSDLPTPK